jgi:hypothetical protein
MRADATEQGSRRSGQAIVGADLDQGGFLEASPGGWRQDACSGDGAGVAVRVPPATGIRMRRGDRSPPRSRCRYRGNRSPAPIWRGIFLEDPRRRRLRFPSVAPLRCEREEVVIV